MTMKAGKYYVGDLCYVMNDAWDEVGGLIFEGRTDHGCNEGEFTLKDGRRFAMYSTAYGDGTYPSNIDTTHCVDSGTIGCILVTDIKDNTDSQERMKELAAIVEFNNDFETSTDGRVIMFDNMEIDTDPMMDEDTIDWDN